MKKIFSVILLTVALLLGGMKASAFDGSTIATGGQYYLYNIYQSKFLKADGTTLSRTATTSDKFTATSTGFTISGTAYTATVVSGNKYKLTNGSNAFMFNTGTSCAAGVYSEGYNASKSEWLLISADEYNEYQAMKRFTVSALNVDGMPVSVKILGVYDLKLNPDGKEEAGATAIGQKLKTMGWDVVGMSEDFNFHSQIWNEAWNNGVTDAANGIWSYNATTHRGDINITAGSYGDFIGKKTIFDTDGLCLFYKRANVNQSLLESSESWTAWNEHYGYTDNGADGLINKGYRYYAVQLADGTEFDLYILHMDAETDPEDNAARESQIVQLATAIKASKNGRPIIVMGDTNCRYTRDRLKVKFINSIEEDPRFTVKDPWIEYGRDGIYPTWDGTNDNSIMVGNEGYFRGEVVDKIFYINNKESDIRINALSYTQDMSFINEAGEPLADHWPVVAEIEYHDYNPAIDDTEKVIETYTWTGVDPTQGGTYYIYHPASGMFLTNEGSTMKVNYPTATTTPTTWVITPSGSSFTMKSGKYYFNLAKTGTWPTYSATPQLSTDENTTELKVSETNTSLNAFKIYRAASPSKLLNYNASEGFTGANNTGVQNDWVFIPVDQYEKQKPQDYIENGVHYYKGIYAEKPTISVPLPSNTGAENAAYAVDLTYASGAGIDGITVDVTNNPNTIIYAKDGAVTNTVNVVNVKTDKCANLVLTDKSPVYIPSKFIAAEATYIRNSSSEWGTIILPYAPVKKEGYTYYTLVGEYAAFGILLFKPVDGDLSANTPYLYRNTTGSALDLSTTAAPVYAAANVPNVFTASTAVDGWNMMGVFEQTSVFASESDSEYADTTNNKVVDANSYYINGNAFLKVNGNFNLAPFRAYFSAGSAEAQPTAFTIVVDDDGKIDIVDLTRRVDALINNTGTGSYYDVNGDGEFNKADIEKAAEIILSE